MVHIYEHEELNLNINSALNNTEGLLNSSCLRNEVQFGMNNIRYLMFNNSRITEASSEIILSLGLLTEPMVNLGITKYFEMMVTSQLTTELLPCRARFTHILIIVLLLLIKLLKK